MRAGRWEILICPISTWTFQCISHLDSSWFDTESCHSHYINHLVYLQWFDYWVMGVNLITLNVQHRRLIPSVKHPNKCRRPTRLILSLCISKCSLNLAEKCDKTNITLFDHSNTYLVVVWPPTYVFLNCHKIVQKLAVWRYIPDTHMSP